MRIVDDALPDPQRRMLLQATAEQIKHTLEAAGAQLGDGWAEGLQRGVRHHTGGRKVSYRQVGAPSGRPRDATEPATEEGARQRSPGHHGRPLDDA